MSRYKDITSDTDDIRYFTEMYKLFKSISKVIGKRNFYGNNFHNRPVISLFCLTITDVLIIN